jgi:hypothetical protein
MYLAGYAFVGFGVPGILSTLFMGLKSFVLRENKKNWMDLKKEMLLSALAIIAFFACIFYSHHFIVR